MFKLQGLDRPLTGFKVAYPEAVLFQIEADPASQVDFVLHQHDLWSV